MSTYQLFMGREIPSGGYVTNEDYEVFLDRVDTLVDGYTSQDANGRWLGVNEDTKVLTIADVDKSTVKTVASMYKDMFKQLAVGVVVLPDMEFV